MAKGKAGKKSKQKVKKAARRQAAPRPSAPAPKAEPMHQEAQETQQAAPKGPDSYPWNVIVKKGAERLPVTVSDAAHYERLCTEFGAVHIEVSK